MSSLPPSMPSSSTLPPPPIPQKTDQTQKMNFQYQSGTQSAVVSNNNAVVQKPAGAVAAGVFQDSDSSYFYSFPPGFRFCPTDDELIDQYLKKKILDQPVPKNRIKEVALYDYHPEGLTEIYPAWGEKQWYFFTQRDRKYKNGNRPNRVARNGYWKASVGDKPIHSNGRHVGDRKVLVFYNGKPPDGKKTNWLMYEYRVTKDSNCQTTRGSNDMKLDEWVLCKIYRRPGKSSLREIQHTEDPLEDVDIRMENSDHPTADQFNEDIGPTNAPNNFNLSREACHAENPLEDVDTRMENSDLPTAHQFNEDTGPTNAPGEEYPNPSLHNIPPLLPSEPYHMFPDNFPIKSNYVSSGYGDPIIPPPEPISFKPPEHFTSSEYQLPSESYHTFPHNFPFKSNYIGSGYGDPIIPPPEPISFKPPEHFTGSVYQLPSESYHTFPDNFPFKSNYIDSGYGDPIIPLPELISFEPPEHFTDSEYQLGSSTTGFANDDDLGFMQQNEDISHRFESFSKNNFDGLEFPSDDFLQDTTWISFFPGNKSE